MKKLACFFVLMITLVACKAIKKEENQLVVTSNKEIVSKDYAISIDKIVSDSRCPEGTNCVWAGELVMELSAWQGKQVNESVVMTFSFSNLEDNKKWFEKYLPNHKKLSKIKISPTKTEKPLSLKDYKIELILE